MPGHDLFELSEEMGAEPLAMPAGPTTSPAPAQDDPNRKRAMWIRLAMLAPIIAKGGPGAVEGFLSGLSTADQQRKVEEQRQAAFALQQQNAQAQQQYRDATLAGGEDQRRQKFIMDGYALIDQAKTPDQLQSTLQALRQQAQGMRGVRPGVFDSYAMGRTPTSMRDNRIREVWETYTADVKKLALGQTDWTMVVDGTSVPKAQWLPAIGMAQGTSTPEATDKGEIKEVGGYIYRRRPGSADWVRDGVTRDPVRAGASAPAGGRDTREQTRHIYNLERSSRAIASIDRILPSLDWTNTGPVAWATSGVPFLPAGELDAELDTLGTQIAQQELAAMRAASPTGGAVGQVSDFEQRMFMNSLAAISRAGTTERFKREQLRLARASLKRGWELADRYQSGQDEAEIMAWYHEATKNAYYGEPEAGAGQTDGAGAGQTNEAAPRGSGPAVGTRRTINGQLAEWDGRGWLPVTK